MITTLPITSKPLENTPEHLSWEAWFMVDSKNPSEKTRKITPKSIFITPNFTNTASCPDGQRLDDRGNCIQVIVVNEKDLVVNRLQELLASSSDANIEYDYDDNYDSKPQEDPIQINIPLSFGHSIQDSIDEYGIDDDGSDGGIDDYGNQSFRDQSLPPPLNVIPLVSEKPDHAHSTTPADNINVQITDTTTEDVPVTTILPEIDDKKESEQALVMDKSVLHDIRTNDKKMDFDDIKEPSPNNKDVDNINSKINRNSNDSENLQKVDPKETIKGELEAESFLFDEIPTTTETPTSTVNDEINTETINDYGNTSTEDMEVLSTTNPEVEKSSSNNTNIADIVDTVTESIPTSTNLSKREQIDSQIDNSNLKLDSTILPAEFKVQSSTDIVDDLELLPSSSASSSIIIDNNQEDKNVQPQLIPQTTENLVIITPQSKPNHNHNKENDYQNLKIQNEPQSDTILRESLMKQEQKETILENIDTRNRFIYHHLGETSNQKLNGNLYTVLFNGQTEASNNFESPLTTTQKSVHNTQQSSPLPPEALPIYYNAPSVVYNLRSDLRPVHHSNIRINNREYFDETSNNTPYRRKSHHHHGHFESPQSSYPIHHNHHHQAPTVESPPHDDYYQTTIPSSSSSRRRMSSTTNTRENSKSPREELFRELTLQDIYKVLGSPNSHSNR